MPEQNKVKELAARFGMLHGDCRDSSAEAFGATVENALRAELKPLLQLELASWLKQKIREYNSDAELGRIVDDVMEQFIDSEGL